MRRLRKHRDLSRAPFSLARQSVQVVEVALTGAGRRAILLTPQFFCPMQLLASRCEHLLLHHLSVFVGVHRNVLLVCVAPLVVLGRSFGDFRLRHTEEADLTIETSVRPWQRRGTWLWECGFLTAAAFWDACGLEAPCTSVRACSYVNLKFSVMAYCTSAPRIAADSSVSPSRIMQSFVRCLRLSRPLCSTRFLSRLKGPDSTRYAWQRAPQSFSCWLSSLLQSLPRRRHLSKTRAFLGYPSLRPI